MRQKEVPLLACVQTHLYSNPHFGTKNPKRAHIEVRGYWSGWVWLWNTLCKEPQSWACAALPCQGVKPLAKLGSAPADIYACAEFLAKKALPPKLMELCKNLGKPSLVLLDQGHRLLHCNMTGKTYWTETAFSLRKMSHSSSAFPSVNNQADLNYISLLKHDAIYTHVKLYVALQFSSKKK